MLHQPSLTSLVKSTLWAELSPYICANCLKMTKFYFSSKDFFLMILEAQKFYLPISIFQIFLIIKISCEAKIGLKMLFESTSNYKVSVSLLKQSAPTSSAGYENCACWKRRSRPSPTSPRMNTGRCLTRMTVSSAPLWRRRGSIQRRTTWTLTVSGEWHWRVA